MTAALAHANAHADTAILAAAKAAAVQLKWRRMWKKHEDFVAGIGSPLCESLPTTDAGLPGM